MDYKNEDENDKNCALVKHKDKMHPSEETEETKEAKTTPK